MYRMTLCELYRDLSLCMRPTLWFLTSMDFLTQNPLGMSISNTADPLVGAMCVANHLKDKRRKLWSRPGNNGMPWLTKPAFRFCIFVSRVSYRMQTFTSIILEFLPWNCVSMSRANAWIAGFLICHGYSTFTLVSIYTKRRMTTVYIIKDFR